MNKDHLIVITLLIILAFTAIAIMTIFFSAQTEELTPQFQVTFQLEESHYARYFDRWLVSIKLNNSATLQNVRVYGLDGNNFIPGITARYHTEVKLKTLWQFSEWDGSEFKVHVTTIISPEGHKTPCVTVCWDEGQQEFFGSG